MNWTVVQRILGLLLMLFSLTMLPPVLFSLYYQDNSWLPFVEGFGITFAAGFLCWLPVNRVRKELRLRDGFLVVAAFWTVLGTAGAAPLYFADALSLTVTDAVFESMSGLTTTGATVLTGLDELPVSILYYRQQLQWLGGMGIIVLAVAVLPMLGVGGMQLYRAETPGPVKDTKLTPRITETAKALWYVYLAFTITCMIGYRIAGMGWFDALCHAFSTVAIGGFSTHDASIAYFDSATVDFVAVIFMFIAGINFSLHFFAWRYVSIKHYLQDQEFRAYAFILMVLSALVIGSLFAYRGFDDPFQTFRHGLFQAVSIGTTTGFTTDNFAAWPAAVPVLLIFASFIGGSAGSTAGGIKVIRWLLVYKQGVREIVRLVHPSAEIPVKLGSKAVPSRVVEAVWGFFSVYIIVFGVMLIAMMATGLDQVTAFSAVAASLNNLGPGLGDVASGFMTLSDPAKWIAVAGMLLGRLEIFTLLVLITPTFWRT
ncbi:MAG: TrkH family potassium uptake protein [Gammaproteobacteria bacterium]|nr:TrkH family potassium uptake protein [Gammaproteobacteria bacterium]NNF50666.1 potassium transporter [Woeseiaceae bacterium]MBT8095374.1 TrkH family potassium uptake protein [Gammaproteobacteria bacterium]MBT8104103.1 TrkH family potassium uptake protein [Gammaproteobacteria bacterium]NNK24118.1 potassium transporter [Woeseiaceae bacterium]